MFFVQLVRYWYEDLIPSVIAGLVATNQQNGYPPRIEGIQNAIRPGLYAEPEARAYECASMIRSQNYEEIEGSAPIAEAGLLTH